MNLIRDECILRCSMSQAIENGVVPRIILPAPLRRSRCPASGRLLVLRNPTRHARNEPVIQPLYNPLRYPGRRHEIRAAIRPDAIQFSQAREFALSIRVTAIPLELW